MLTSIATSTVGLTVMIGLAVAAFGLSFVSYGLTLLVLVLVLFVFGIAVGVAGCAVVLRFGPSAEWFVWPISALLAPFAGVFYPLTVLPRWMQAIAATLPPSHVFEGTARGRDRRAPWCRRDWLSRRCSRSGTFSPRAGSSRAFTARPLGQA